MRLTDTDLDLGAGAAQGIVVTYIVKQKRTSLSV